MTQLVLAFVGGFLGSAHCVGMCGVFAMLVGKGARGTIANLLRQVCYSGGRIFTYAAGGAATGYLGVTLTREAPTLFRAQAVLALLAGGLLILQGLISAGLLNTALGQTPLPCLGLGSWRNLLRDGRPLGYALFGMLTAFLPCGLVYAYLALAASSGAMWKGALTMIAFGLGTAPLMLVAGCGAHWLTARRRQFVLRFAAICVIATGFLSVARGLAQWRVPDENAPTACPLCLENR